MARASFIHGAIESGRKAEETLSINPGEYYEVRAKIAMINKHFKAAETIYLEQVSIGSY